MSDESTSGTDYLPSDGGDQDLLREFLDEAMEGMESVSRLLVMLEQKPNDLVLINAIFRPVHSIKGLTSFFRFDRIQKLAHELESLLDLLRKERLRASTAVIQILLECVDAVKTMLVEIRTQQPPRLDKAALEALMSRARLASQAPVVTLPDVHLWIDLIDKLDRIYHRLPQKDRRLLTGIEKVFVAIRALAPQTATPEARPVPVFAPSGAAVTSRPEALASDADVKVEHKTMRVSEEAVDVVLGQVGQLKAVGEMYQRLEQRLMAREHCGDIALDFSHVNEVFAQVSASLQASLHILRKVPVLYLLQKAPRLARDIAIRENKEIGVELQGQTLEVDKSLADRFDAPLAHLVRNAADHGIERPDLRQAEGKSRQGTIWVTAEETETHIVLTVRDDGRGLDREAIQKKAETMGLILPGQVLSDSVMADVICRPGFTTAAGLTEVSGRGVGLDVVHRALAETGGSLQVQSVPGKGCAFRLHVPKTQGKG